MNNQNRIYEVTDAHITFRNFTGEARQYNQAGNRNFNLILTPDMAETFADAGFRVRERKRRDPDDEQQFLMQVNVSYKFRAPRVVVIHGKKKTELNEDTISELDYADIEYIDLTIRPYHWTMPDGRTGIKAYLNSMYVTLAVDPFEDKYSDLDDNAVDDEEEPF